MNTGIYMAGHDLFAVLISYIKISGIAGFKD